MIIMYARVRQGSSALCKINMFEIPVCQYGHPSENVERYFLEYIIYNVPKELINSVPNILPYYY